MIKKLLLVFLAGPMLVAANAATFDFTDRGLSYTIDTTNPLLGTVAFDAFSVAASGAMVSTIDGNFTPYTVNVDAASFDVLQTDPVGLDVDFSSGVATPCCGPLSAAISLQGTYSAERNGVQISGSWLADTIIRWDLPGIDVSDLPDTAPLISDIQFVSSPFVLVDTTIDGQAFRIVARWFSDQYGDVSLSTFGVPIPPALFLFGSAISIFGMVRRRRA